VQIYTIIFGGVLYGYSWT